MALTSTKGKVPTGHADEIVISESSFRAGHRDHERSGVPSKKRKREGRGDSGVVYGDNAYKGPWAKYTASPDPSSGSEEEYEEYEEIEDNGELSKPLPPPTKAGTAYEETGNGAETSEFHGSEQYDYQGRTYMHVPQDLGIDLLHDDPDLKNYHPKKLLHTWKSHTKAISQTRFFPSSGHLLLSAAADSKVKIWDVYHQRELLRTYSGHSKAVSDIDFTPDGINFLSASYDRQMKLWDTETGACISRFSTGKTPHVIRVNPSSPHEFLAGMNDKKIVQFDTRSDDTKPVQEYDHHLGPINTITFCDENRRFITTSDDKSLRAWEYNIPVPIKFIAEPHMFHMSRAAPHPSGRYAAFQSADNQIVVYSSVDRFRQNRKKGFRGHNTAGYAIDVAISPDGGLVASGDSAGFLCVWDWKTCRLYHKIQTSDVACLSVAWHPKETSKVVTGSLDGVLRYWD